MPRHARELRTSADRASEAHASQRPRTVLWLVLLAIAVMASIWLLRSAGNGDTAPDTAAARPTPDASPMGDGASNINDPAGAKTDGAPAPDAPAADAPAEPIAASAIPPEFPLDAVRRGESGRVLLKVPVGVDGQPGGISVIESSGSEVLDRAALEAVSRWRFQPARRDGEEAASTLEIPIDFRPPG